jgi:hypothetical protein
MNKRFLIKYLYKGKQFSVAFSEGTTNKHFLIGKKLTIGSDPSLLWQIYNPSFPKKHDLIINENGKYYFNLLKSFSISVKKGDKDLSLDEIKSLGLLKDNRLYLNEDYEGEVVIDENTTISFRAIPKPAPLTAEQKKLVSLLNRWPAISTQQKVTRFTVISVILAIIIFASIVGWTYTPSRAKTIFDRTEENIMVSMQVESPIEISQETTEFYEEPEIIEEGDGEAEAKAQEEAEQRAADAQRIQDRIAQRRRSAQANSQERYQNVGEGGGDQAGTGTALAVRSRVRGLRGTSRASSSFDIDVDTDSDYGGIAEALGRQADSQINTAVVSARGVRASDVRGRRTARIGSGETADIGTLNSNLGDGFEKVETIESTEIDDTELEKRQIERTKRERRDLTDNEKETQIREWFTSAILPRINQEFNSYKLRKTIRGKLDFRLIFKDDKIIKAIIRGQGSINDKTFIANLQKIIEGRALVDIGTYTINISQRFE